MKYLIVGLGNIGAEYRHTRHNIGFMIVDHIAAQNNVNFKLESQAYHTSYKYKGRQVHMIKPTTYMNLSGKAVNYWMKYYKIPKENVLVLVDDLALPLGTLRIKTKGSSAGHNGLKNIEQTIGGQNYSRLRFGIGNDYPKGRQVDFVLGKFTEDEMAHVNLLIEKSEEMVNSFCFAGVQNTMNTFNGEY